VWGIPFHKTHRSTWSADWPPSSWSVSSNWHHTLCLLITRVLRHERKSPKHKKSMYYIWDWDCTVTQATARKSTYSKARTNSDHENQTPRMRITIFADNSCFLRAFRLPLNQIHSECQSSKNNCTLNKLKSTVGWYAMDMEALSKVESVSEYSTTSTMSFHCHGKENLTNWS
jgi:hypothetical protein